jgi:signal transduction histidine kinase
MKISYLIFVGFLLILIMFSVTTYINIRQAEKVNENSEWFSRSTTVVRNSNRFQRNILNMISGLRGYLFTGENFFIQSYDSASAENNNILKELSSMIPDTSAQQKEFQEIVALNKRWQEEFAHPLIAAKKASTSSDSSMAAFNKLYRERLTTGIERNFNRTLQVKFRDFSNKEYDLREQHRQTLTVSIQQTRNISFLLNTLSIILGILIAFFLAVRISTGIMRMVKMADDISMGNYEVSTQDKGKDELSLLAKSLNHMAKVLSANIALLKRKNEELDQFAHIVSHDLKAPLRGIDNVITWIEEDHANELSPKLQEYIQHIRGRLIRSENLIRGILSYSRIGRENPVKESVNLNNLMDEIKDNLKVPSGINLIIQKNLPRILTDRVPLHQVLSNLIGNAIKYHDKVEGEVKVSFADKITHYEFAVTDDGPGIAKNYHDKIFGIFQTLQERDSFESTGIGLAIVKKILDDRGQRIELISEPGKGSTFLFTWSK